MAQPYVGEIRMFGGNFNPAGWLFCEGQLLPISENEPLFQLIGTTYGGDGQSTFGLPDLRGRITVHQSPGNGFPLAQPGGVEDVTLTSTHMPVHTHALAANSSAGSSPDPTSNVLAGSPTIDMFRESAPSVSLANNTLGPAGGSQPHANFQPYLCISFIISLFGIFPTPTYRGRGIGAGLLRRLVEEAQDSGRKLSIHVEVNNPARTLYDRLGFRPVGEHGVYLLMERGSRSGDGAPVQAKIAS